MKTVLFCGGRGVIDPETRQRIPKGMTRIGEPPVLWHIMNSFATYGHKEFILALGERAETIRDYFLRYGQHRRDLEVSLADGARQYLDRSTEEDWRVQLVDTGLQALTGSRLARCGRYLEGETFLLTYSDCLCNVNINALLAFHRKHGKVATVTGVTPSSRFGTFHVADGKVTKFSTKTRLVGKDGYINGGYMVFEPEIFRYVEPFSECNLEAEIFTRLAEESQVAIYPHEGFWQTVDTERDVKELNDLYHQNQRPWLPEPGQFTGA